MSSSGVSSRQRNCSACVRGKRRCDKRKPACGRCVRQRYPCIYGGRGLSELSFGDSADAPFGMDCLMNPTSNPDPFVPAPDALPTMLGADMGLAPDVTFQLPVVDNDLGSLLASLPGSGHSGSSNSFLGDTTWSPQFTGISGVVSPEMSLVRKDYSKMAPMCQDYAPWQLADPSSKASFTIGVFKKFHVTFAQTSCTPYIHRYLYKDNVPHCMLQAFSMCLLYTNQSASNRAMVLRVLDGNVRELKATAGSPTLKPLERLARVHALMFYQTIRMFDGDITLGQQVDDDMALLESWNRDLCKSRDNLDDFATKGKAVGEHPPESWERWIFAESLRRTCITCFCVQRFWSLLKIRIKSSDMGNWPFDERWTLSSHIWNAENSFDFFRAWREKPVYIISSFNFEEFLKTGTGDDLDDFAYYFITLCFGVNEIKTFCYETSGRLLVPA
ncbi:hypothetical protein F5Y14DRAFT_433546 [Nemania sp. NC0429]|nr:hypothetical protein F5Y14DRAFT_433546 [Nemania sp. NC0429]